MYHALKSSPSRVETVFALALILAALAFILPELMLFQDTPMGGDKFTLKDPSVSSSAFMPAFREFRYELLNHGNFLWSNLRALGQPMLGNGVQGAPLFPLNLALIWMPDQLYWSVMPLARLALVALGCFLLARNVFGMGFIPSLAFAAIAGLNINFVRWLNHPWSNGLLAGVWYLYFHCRLLRPASTAKRELLLLTGVSLSMFALITCGFPEATIVSAFLALFIFLAVAAVQINVAGVGSLGRPILLMALANLIGLGLGSAQLLALIEYVNYSDAWGLRDGFIAKGYVLNDLAPYWLSQLTVVSLKADQLQYLTFSMGLAGTFLAFLGGCVWLGKSTTMERWIGGAFLFLMTLFIIKNFLMFEAVERIFAATPILAESHFPLYFSPLFYFGFAYFAALGVSALLQKESQAASIKILVIIGLIVILTLAHFYAVRFLDVNLATHVYRSLTQGQVSTIIYFCLFALVVLVSIQFRFHLRYPALIGLVMVATILLELSASLAKGYSPVDHFLMREKQELRAVLPAMERAAQLPMHEFRGRDKDGSFVSLGLATIDNGVSAILPIELRAVRKALFNTTYGGYRSLDGPRFPWSYQALSANINATLATPIEAPRDWSQYRLDQSIQPQITQDRGQSFRLSRNPLFLTGSVRATTVRGQLPEFWMRLSAAGKTHWVRVNIGGIKGVQLEGKGERREFAWRVRLAEEWLDDTRYDLIIRVVDQLDGSFADTEPIMLDLSSTQQSIGSKLIAQTDDGRWLMYYDPAALPRSFTATGCQVYPDRNGATQHFASEDDVTGGVVAFIDGAGWPALDCASLSGDRPARVSVLEDNGDLVRLAAVQGPALLVLNDAYYPGWRARDRASGEEFEIKPANITVRAIHLPDNKTYNIDFSYRPTWLTWFYLSLVASLGLTWIMILVVNRPHRRSS